MSLEVAKPRVEGSGKSVLTLKFAQQVRRQHLQNGRLLRSEGPALNSLVREGVDQEHRSQLSAEGAA